MALPWRFHGSSVALPWRFRGASLVLPWRIRGASAVLPRVPKHTAKSPLSYTIHMILREGDLAENINIRSSLRAATYSLIFQTVLPGGLVQFSFSKWPPGRTVGGSYILISGQVPLPRFHIA